MATQMQRSVEAAFRGVLEQTNATATIHAVSVDDPSAEVGLGADELAVVASVFKVPVLIELTRQAAAGELSLTERVTVAPEGRAAGPTGLSVMLDPVELSLRDLAFLMMSVSDNAATDIVLAWVGGAARVNETMRSLGLPNTVIEADCTGLYATILEDLGIDPRNPVTQLDEVAPEVLASCRCMRAEATNRSTARETTRLLSMIWRDEAGDPEACAETRRIMGLQAWPHRLTSGFPDGVRVSGKTGTLPSVRNEVGVVEYPDGSRYAVAVFLRTKSYGMRLPASDAAIGELAAMAVEHLRARS